MGTPHIKFFIRSGSKTVVQLRGAYGTVVMNQDDPSRLIVARSGSPLVIGYGVGENFLASDPLALLSVTRRFAYLEEGDVAEITRHTVDIYSRDGQKVEREIHEGNFEADAADKGPYRHYMQKEIFEQPVAIMNTLDGRIENGKVKLMQLVRMQQRFYRKLNTCKS
ncbi:glucosamine--fructose-6-phosphate aminotransferase [Actinobacillus equuli]|nr:glucosamine--fructose-6-phosphate aminotransferase [Actinobacillus equuli]